MCAHGHSVDRANYSQLRLVNSVYLTWDAITGEATLELVMETEGLYPSQRARFCFGGVRDLQIRDLGKHQNRIIGFDVVEISERGWEDAKYEVLDFEHDQFHLYSRTMVVEWEEAD